MNLSLPLGIQAIINLIQGAQVSTSWIILVILVTSGVAFVGLLQLMQIRIIENVQQKIFTRASFEFAYRFPKIKMSQLRNYYPPELANRFFDTLSVQKGIPKILVDLSAATLQILFGLILLALYHPFFVGFGFVLNKTNNATDGQERRRGLHRVLQRVRTIFQGGHLHTLRLPG